MAYSKVNTNSSKTLNYLNKDYNSKTRRCNKKCEKGKIRDKNFKCVTLKK